LIQLKTALTSYFVMALPVFEQLNSNSLEFCNLGKGHPRFRQRRNPEIEIAASWRAVIAE
jgi:hypothetical protein